MATHVYSDGKLVYTYGVDEGVKQQEQKTETVNDEPKAQDVKPVVRRTRKPKQQED